MSDRDRERERLARRAASGDLEAAKRLVVMLEAEAGKQDDQQPEEPNAQEVLFRQRLFREWPTEGPRKTPAQRAVLAMREALLNEWARAIASGFPFASASSVMLSASRETLEGARDFVSLFSGALPQIADRIVRTCAGEIGIKTGAANVLGDTVAVAWPDGRLTWVPRRSLERQGDGTWRIAT